MPPTTRSLAPLFLFVSFILSADAALAVDAPALPAALREAELKAHAPVEIPAEAEAPPVVLRGATLLTAAGARIERGYLVLEHGRIAAVGSGDPPVREGATIVDATGLFITPGLIDTHSHLGVYPAPGLTAHDDGNEATSPTTAGVWAEHSFWPQDPQIEQAVAGGVTTLLALPGSANLIGGRGVVMHLVPHRGGRAMRLSGAPDSLKMACGENPKRVYGGKGGAPSTRMGNVRGQREAFLAARRYLDDWQRYQDKVTRAAAVPDETARKKKKDGEAKPEEPPQPPARDLNLDTLAAVLTGDILVQIHCYRADDMLDMVQLSHEMGFKIRTFHHALEAYKIRDVLAREGIATATWADWWGFKAEAYDGIPENAALVASAGARAIIKSDSPIDDQRLNQEAGKVLASARAQGIPLDEDGALRMITANPAWALGIDDQVGTLEPGKRADVVVWDHEPLSVAARARYVYIDGALRYDATDPHAAPWSDFMAGQELEP